MAVAEKDIKLLWGRAAGFCSNPGCREELTLDLDAAGSLSVGEMAHVIARQPAGPRGDGMGGDNSYSNLILLCPSCHTLVDKAPSDFPEDKLRGWKSAWEAEVRTRGRAQVFDSLSDLKTAVAKLLTANRQFWADFGPNSKAAERDPGFKPSPQAEAWPAPGSEDTELGVLMEPEVGHGETEVYAGVQA
jgi:HNH endonuclease